jgi:folate-dependent phosphoribosylglycinamide formyltransferase PurN
MKKILVLGVSCASTWMLVHELKHHFRSVHIVIEDREPAWTFIRRRIYRLGVIPTLGQITFALYSKLAAARARPAVEAYVRKSGLEARALSDGEFTAVKSVNDAKVQEIIASIQPDVIVVSGTRIIRKHILDTTNARFLNAHYGITPMYRGVHGAYWALAQSDAENCGVTIHFVDRGVDTGAVLYQAHIMPSKSDNFFTYPTLQAIAATPLMIRAVRDCLQGRAITNASVGPSRQWYHPTLWQYIWTGVRRGVW